MLTVELALTKAGLIVQTVETDNDIGRDAYVEITAGRSVSGGVVAIQVKSGVSFFRNERWFVPGTEADFTLWRETSVPMFGIVHNPLDNSLRWADLSRAALRDYTSMGDAFGSDVVDGGFGRRAVVAAEDNRLDLDTEPFLTAARDAIRQGRGLPAFQLLSRDVETVQAAIMDSFALGRHTPQAFLLLAALLSRLPKDAQHLAVSALAMATHHPDVFWTKNNWIPGSVKSAVAQSCHWTNDDVSTLLGLIADDDDGIQRGTFGQHVFHVLTLDSNLTDRLIWIIEEHRLGADKRYWAGAILLYLAGQAAPEVLNDLLARAPDIGADSYFSQLAEIVREYGYLDLF